MHTTEHIRNLLGTVLINTATSRSKRITKLLVRFELNVKSDDILYRRAVTSYRIRMLRVVVYIFPACAIPHSVSSDRVVRDEINSSQINVKIEKNICGSRRINFRSAMIKFLSVTFIYGVKNEKEKESKKLRTAKPPGKLY